MNPFDQLMARAGVRTGRYYTNAVAAQRKAARDSLPRLPKALPFSEPSVQVAGEPFLAGALVTDRAGTRLVGVVAVDFYAQEPSA